MSTSQALYQPAGSDKYTMRISRLTIDKLGIKMYDRVSAVLAEIIANAYDADASDVTIKAPLGEFLADKNGDRGLEIVVTDNGHGMTTQDVNELYLYVGIDRRKKLNSDRSRERNRHVMGRKGIGKLAPFGICNEIEVITAAGPPGQQQYPVAHLILNYGDLVMDEQSDDDPNEIKPYHPQPGPLDGTAKAERGTQITLRRFHRRHVPSAKIFQKQLTARFGLRRTDWQVRVEDTTLNTQPFSLDEELEIPLLEGSRVDVDNRPIEMPDGRKLFVTGWVAYAKEPYADEVMAGVRIYAHGKIVSQTRDFDIPAGFTGEFKLRSYLVGRIDADWLDEDTDLIRSDRQDIMWSSDEGEVFKKWGQSIVRELAAKAEPPMKTQIWKEFLAISNLETEVNAKFPDDAHIRQCIIDAAKLVVRRNDRESIRDEVWVKRVKSFAYAVGPHKSLLDTLAEVASAQVNNLDVLVELLGRAKVAELYSLGQIASERLEALGKLKGLTKGGSTLEKPLQKLIEEAPWIIAPEWTPITMDRPLSEFREAFESWYEKEYGKAIVTSAIENPTKEPDFIFINSKVRLEIIEIKKPDWNFTDEEFDRAVVFRPKWHRGSSRELVFLGVITSPGRMSDERDEWIGSGSTRPAEV